MRIKRLDLFPMWGSLSYPDEFEALDEQMELEGFQKINPLFKRNGWYLINNFISVIEADGNAWITFNDRIINSFKETLKDAHHNKLSAEIVKAFEVLNKANLLSEKQKELINRDYWIQYGNKLYYRSS